MHLMNGYQDPEYLANFNKSVNWLPIDDTMQTILHDQSTKDWNPVIYALFYRRQDLLTYLCESGRVYVRSCLLTPFMVT